MLWGRPITRPVQKNEKSCDFFKKALDLYCLHTVYLGMRNEINNKGTEKMTELEVEQLGNALNESFNGEAESMAREQAMADMMLGGTEFDWQEMQDYANLVTDVMPEAL